MRDYKSVSYWLETSGDDLMPRPAFAGTVQADVAILGGGYSGLWVAYYLLKNRPGLKVVILEAETAGFGASGRNGGWLSSGFPVSPQELVKRFGRDAARSLLQTVAASIDEVARVLGQEGIEAHCVKGGALHLARGKHQLPALHREREAYEALGLGDRHHVMPRAEVEDRVRVTKVEGALFTPDCATIHPGRLVRGLARAVEKRGGRIYEQSRVLDVRKEPSPALVSAEGSVQAETVVLAGEAYLTRLPGMRRTLLPAYSLILLTEPLDAEVLAQIGWEGRECLSSYRYTVDYLSRTADGRILFGSRGAPYHFGSRIADGYDRHAATHATIERLVHEWFPMLEDVRFTHSWGGPVGMPRDWMPTVSFDKRRGVATARGYTGQGVATSNLAGRILADLILGQASDLTHLPLVNHRSPKWEPEPLRWMAVRYIQNGLTDLDVRSERSGMAPSGKSLAERLAHH